MQALKSRAALLAVLLLGTPGALPAFGQTVLHVAPPDGAAAAGDGSAARPFRSLGAAIRAWSVAPLAVPVTIVMAPGTYREAVEIHGGPAPRLRIRAAVPGAAVLSGSDVVTVSQRAGATRITIEQAPVMPLSPIPDGWPAAEIGMPARWREMVFHEGSPLLQVERPVALQPGGFLADRVRGRFEVALPPGANARRVVLEVARRPRLLTIAGAQDIEITGLVFQHANSRMADAAVVVDGARRVRITDSVFRANNAAGLSVKRSRDITLERNVLNGNGEMGLGMWRVRNALVSGNETSANNWRGESGGYTGWSSAGMKTVELYDAVVERHRARDNRTYGVWFDFNISRVTLRDSEICDNLRFGVVVEAAQGPVEVSGSRICGNAEGGVLGAEARGLRLVGNVIACNGRRQIYVSGQLDRPVADSFTGARLVLNNAGWEVEGNLLAGRGRERLVETTLPLARWRGFLAETRLSGNTWLHPSGAAAFAQPARAADWGVQGAADAAVEPCAETAPANDAS
ncbi:right-handed parallel beta-helix repeat-containing protein [Falsiroseomonas sp. HW251]|uniref:right-handed parallel beta-helix repeat-containing protein n=1 Tax=Falsiroseomonas sp. HW251 TaxID=3390998 RepID=UPI003D318823